MIDTLAQAYHWSFEDTIRRTMPQIIMLNAAASVNKKRTDAKLASQKEKGEGSGSISNDIQESAIDAFTGKKVEELNSEEYIKYLQSGLI